MKRNGFGNNRTRRWAAISVTGALLGLLLPAILAQPALADSPDPIESATTGTVTENPNGTHTLAIEGRWEWTRNCGQRTVGWEVDWNDPDQPGNFVAVASDGVRVEVGAAQDNGLNPADNTVDHAGLGNCQDGNPFTSGKWGPISHTYAANVASARVCVVVYDTKGGEKTSGKHSLIAGGPDHNEDNSIEENFRPSNQGCFGGTFQLGEPVIDIEKTGPAEAQRGDTITYTMSVSIPSGQIPLTNVVVTDPRCDSAPTLQSKTGDQDDTLEAGELWTYTCTHLITNADPNPLPNTATATGTGPQGQQVTDQDSHLVDVVANPNIKIEKTGPQSAKVGDTITYTLEVSISVDRPLHNVNVSDPKCDGAPKLETKGGGDNDDLLEFGEVWIYTCDHKVTGSDIGVLKNTADVSGKDEDDKRVTDEDSHNVEVSKVKGEPPDVPPPPSGPLPFTGFTATYALLVALGLLTAGALSLFISTRKPITSRRRRS